MKRITTAIITVSMVVVLCACGNVKIGLAGGNKPGKNALKTYTVKEITLSLPDSWTVEDINTYADTLENESNAAALRTFSYQSDESLAEEVVLDTEDIPAWLCLYCYNVAGTDNVGTLDEVRENAETDTDPDKKSIEEIRIDTVDGLKTVYESENGDYTVIVFFANGYLYEMRCFNKNGDMDRYLDTVLSGISIREDTNTMTMSIGDLEWTMKGIWAEDADYIEDDEDAIRTVCYDYSDNLSYLVANQYENETLAEITEIIDYWENESEDEFLGYDIVEIDGIGEVLFGYFYVEDDSESYYRLNIFCNTNEKDYLMRIATDSEESMRAFASQIQETMHA